MQNNAYAHIWIAISALWLVSCGPSTSGATLEEAGLRRIQLSRTSGWTISGLTNKAPQPASAAVIFIHGTPGSAEGWVDMMKSAPGTIHALALDRPGYGETQPNDAVTSLEKQALAVIQVAEALRSAAEGKQAPVILVGHSYGGPIAAKAAEMNADLFSAIVIAAGALDPALEDIHWAQRLGRWQPFKFLIGHTLRTANAELMTLEGELEALSPKLADITVPVWIIHGTDDELVPYANVPFMEKAFDPSAMCDIVTLEGQNHFLPWNEVQAFWDIIMRAAEKQDDATC